MGCTKLAKKVLDIIDGKDFKFLYETEMSIKDKINSIATKIYGADGVDYTKDAERHLERIEGLNLNKLPICMAKTQNSLSDDAKLIGRPKGFRITVRDMKISAGAGFIVVSTGKILTMPGLPKVPNAEAIGIDDNGEISGLF